MYLEELSNLPGVSGDEGQVRQALLKYLQEQPGEVRVDALGNVLVRRKAPPGGKRIMLTAHMDEVGLMVTSIEKSGHLRFEAVGMLDPRVLVAKGVRVGREGIPGVIGSKAIHLQKPDERRKPYQLEQLFIDIGAKNKEEAEKLVSPGDYVSFAGTFTPLGEGYYRGKAFDDRAGCSVLLELLLEYPHLAFDAAFTVQEEVGSRGAAVAAYSLNPDKAVVLEGTSAADIPGTDPEGSATRLGEGPAITFMDQSVIADRGLVRELVRAAEGAGLPYQYRRFTGGQTDAGAVSLAREGVPCTVVSVPCRYIHSPHCLLQERDLKLTVDLIRAWLEG
ncbi:MAG TPA: M42 family metallopeptidase [Bacillota bacterium]|nr:M42 family metallopeptidase [Bacillota bacterium]HOB86102.1 M42 family metallopeptidase [Bacillota bacterium]HOP68665.1 M42 family metallopeptidase [Bacillota bacterium]HPT34212.1 M42 family metallopeptidase [Bacillota bacterium]HPZ64215.1 M42 family metallopeptidase [Bacillota bacterium]